MTLHDLTDQLSPHFPVSVQKDLKTAVSILAQALSYPDAKSCPLDACLRPLPDLYHAVEGFLTSLNKGPHTIRNTKNNLSRLFRLAQAEGIFSLLPARLTRAFPYTRMPNRPHALTTNDGSYLVRRHWPPALDQEFVAWAKWATDPLVKGREAKWKKRQTTIRLYETLFSAYFGFLTHQMHISPVTFDHLFQFDLLERFVDWHINEKWKRATTVSHQFLRFVQAMATQYRPNPALLAALKSLRARLPKPQPVLNKSDSWLSLHELERVGLALWPTDVQQREIRYRYNDTRQNRNRPGSRLACRAGTSLMLRLWVHIPYRQRNMREMKLEKNLYRTPEGQWRIRFVGEEMKIATKRGQVNVFDLPFPPTLVSTLEAYLTTWRPLLAVANSPEVFLNARGLPHQRHDRLSTHLAKLVYSFTGRRWHPHMIRTVWATEWIQSSGDFMTAAIMLNDKLETVIQNYSHLREENVAEHAYEWVQKRINGH
jgi:hypothetical protein